MMRQLTALCISVIFSLPAFAVERLDTVPLTDVFIFVENPPKFPGGDASLQKYLDTALKYPAEAAKDNISGTVFVNFIVNKEGELKAIRTVGQRQGGGLEEEAIRVVKAMPKWVPGKQNGHIVNVEYNLPVQFKQYNGGEEVFTMPERMATYPGGLIAMMNHINSNMNYPKEAMDKGLRGIVMVVFLISSEGAVSNVRTFGKKKGGGLEEEAIRLVSIMPNWKPAKHKRKAVASRHVVEINFLLAL